MTLVRNQAFNRHILQCSTVVRNTVVRATINVNGKLQIWAPITPKLLNQSI